MCGSVAALRYRRKETTTMGHSLPRSTRGAPALFRVFVWPKPQSLSPVVCTACMGRKVLLCALRPHLASSLTAHMTGFADATALWAPTSFARPRPRCGYTAQVMGLSYRVVVGGPVSSSAVHR